mgnify:CR=1 FL=1
MLINEENIEMQNTESETVEVNNAEAETVENFDPETATNMKDQEVVKIDDYLSSEILNVKAFSQEDSDLPKGESHLNSEYDESIYKNLNSEIQEKQVVEGTVVGVNDKGVIIDIGFKSEGIIDRSDFKKIPDIGDKVDVFLITFENRKGEMVLSKEKADFAKRWEELRNAYADETIIKGVITKRIKGGFVVDLDVVNAFLPGSQLEAKSITDYDQYLNNEYEFKIVKFNEFRQNIVVSRKAILSGENDEKRKELLANLEVGSVHNGLIKNITDFGAFIDLGGIDGLLHITDITWGRINHPTEKLSIGDHIDVKIIDFDEKTSRISLGTKQLTVDPWQEVAEKFEVGSVVLGKVVNLMNYGMFVEINEGVEGLVHISEMSWTKHVKHPSDMFKMGDEIDTKVLSINVDEKKISLGIKQLDENPWDEIENKYNVGDTYSCKIKNVVNNGVFLELENNIEGFMHNNDISWTRKMKSINDFTKEDSIEVKILEVSSKDKKILLSHKHMFTDPWENIDSHIKLDDSFKAKVLFKLEKGVVCLFNDSFEGVVQINNDNHNFFKNINTNDEIDITVTSIDSEKRKMSLEVIQPTVEEPIS